MRSSAPSATSTATTATLRTSTPANRNDWLRYASDAAGSPIWLSRMSISNAMLCRTNEIANVVTSMTVGDCSRSGRKTARSIASESAITTAKHATMLQSTRPVRRVGERVRAGHDELAIGEVDEAQDAEDEPDADGHERVGRSQADRIDDHLGVDRRERECADDVHERYAATIVSVSPASAGVIVSRISPFAIR